MKKGGWLSFAIYALYFLVGGGASLYFYLALNNAENGELGWGALGVAIIMILCIIFGAAGLLGLILKLIHMKSGWNLFGILCILVDVVLVLAWIYMAAPGGNTEQIKPEDILPSIPFIILSAVSAISNIKSLGD